MRETCFSIYAAEANVGECKTGLEGQDYHSFLVIVDETPGRDPAVVEELHFLMQSNGLEEGQKPYLHAVTKQTDRDLSSIETKGYVGGTASVMVPIWNKAVDISSEISSLELEFSQSCSLDSVNCRAGSKAVIEGLGLDYAPVLEGGAVDIGSGSNLVDQLSEEVVNDGLYL